jgi:ATP-dependent helicase Lhr and Lhr-like helicase
VIDLADLLRVLDRLEEREAALIGWGDSAGYFTLAEFDAVIAEVLPDQDAEEVEDALRERVMIVPVLDAKYIEVGVRTRMAEAVHLYRNLRQWFHGQKLEEARTLVSDYRFIRRKRVYPVRDINFAELVQGWRGKSLPDSQVERAMGAIVSGRTLAGFQARATERILKAWDTHGTRSNPASATIICAGTGSGKTLAFYLPVLSCLAASLVRDKEARVRVLAIYPRKELLKDQFSETWEQCRKLDQQLKNAGARKVRIGALFGETPHSSRYALSEGRDYLHYRLLNCPNRDCRGEMRWSRQDVEDRLERLRCHTCGSEICHDEIGLTRQSMASSPPDVLFTTTEMLNQKMTDSQLRHLFGIGVAQALPIVLLDEVHTYHGAQGAQTAMLLARWMRLSGNRPHFVGLSATLRDAASYFATLTSTNSSRVSLIEPDAREMEESGAEYLLALRGDPVSQTALLSTTIQAGMLTRRVLDSHLTRKSRGVWGCKTFMFTDDLDVNNRLFSGVADAEGWKLRGGNLWPGPSGPLAELRNTTSSASPGQLRNLGQDWAVAKAIGFTLDGHDRARVSRTSSQDTGYARESEIVVTTASLEVGFNDLDVGAVIQHKAPRGIASYLQRKEEPGARR